MSNILDEISNDTLTGQINDLVSKCTGDTGKILRQEIIGLVAQLTDAFVLDDYRQELPRKLGLSKPGYDNAVKQARAAFEERRNEERAALRSATSDALADVEQRPTVMHPYAIQDGMLQLCQRSEDGDTGAQIETFEPICTFTAQITGEKRSEYDDVSYIIAGVSRRGGAFTVEVDSDTFGTPSRLKIALETAVGPLDTVLAKMDVHLGPAIKLLSEDCNVMRHRRYERTGWIDGKFYIPGRMADNIEISLPDVLPFESVPITDQSAAVNALAAIMAASADTVTPILLSSVAGPAIASRAGLSNHRYGTMLRGQTGVYKTGFLMAFMSIWGPKFQDKNYLIGWGTKATGNAVMHLATSAYDMPLSIDNYKSNTANGEKGFVETMHAIIEGGEKLRMMGKANKLREYRQIQAWPFCTGEDMPQGDPATLARFLVVNAKKSANGVPAGILFGGSVRHIPQIGTMILDWLESDAAAPVIDDLVNTFAAKQRAWRSILLGFNQGMPNVDRVASTLAINQSVFIALTKHPAFGHILTPYIAPHEAGLTTIAEQMSGATTDGLEAFRLMSAIKEALVTGRAIILKSQEHDEHLPKIDRDRVIGRVDGGDTVYLYPRMCRSLVERLGVDLGKMSDAGIANQMEELGWLAGRNKDSALRTVRIGWTTADDRGTMKVFHLHSKALGKTAITQGDDIDLVI